MTTRVVPDSSAVIAMLTDDGATGAAAADSIGPAELSAPALMVFEAANVLRRHESAGILEAGQAAQAHADLVSLDVDLWPYDLLAARAWGLRSNLTVADASYVALAELLGATLLTLDRRLAGAPGLRCEIEVL